MGFGVLWLVGQDFLKQLLGLVDLAERQENIRQLVLEHGNCLAPLEELSKNSC